MAEPDLQQGLEVVQEGGLRKAIGGYTWPGIEFGEPPSCPYTFFEYIDALRLGDLRQFQQIEAACEGWYWVGLDRGAGAALHFAADHGRLDAVRFLVERRGAAVNQRDAARGWTPLMRCARMAHHKHAPFLQVFEYLLQQGADPSIRGFAGSDCTLPSSGGDDGADGVSPEPAAAAAAEHAAGPGLLDVAAEKGWGWEPGAVRAELARLIAKHEGVPKAPAHVYRGPPLGEPARQLLAAWEALPALYPPADWRPPPPAGYADAQGARRASAEAWRPAGQRDGSAFVRAMTAAELAEQAQRC